MNSLQQFELPQEAIRLIHNQASSDITKYIKKAFGNNLMGLFESIRQTQHQKQFQDLIRTDFARLNTIIDEIQNHLQLRFQSYEKDILAIVKQEIEQMNVQTKRLISDLHETIEEKEVNNQLWHLRNETDFFKSQALKLFEANKVLRLQIKILKKTIQDYQVQFQANDLTIQKLKKKQLKQRLTLKQSIEPHQLGIKLSDKNRIRINKFRLRQKLDAQSLKKMKTEGNQQKQLLQYPKSTIKLPNYTLNHDKMTDNLSIPSLSYHTKLNDSLERYSLKKTDSCEVLEVHQMKQSNKKYPKNDKSTQTNFNLRLKITNQGISQDLQDNIKNINLLKSGFVVNTPSRLRKQSIFRKSIDCPIQKDVTDMVEMHRTFAKNKLLSSSLSRSRNQRALFKSTRQ